MSHRHPALALVDRRTPAAPPPIHPSGGTRITVYGCGADEAALVRTLAPRLGLLPTLTSDPLGDATVALASGSRSVSIDHRTRVPNRVLIALRRAGVEHLSTRSIGCDHLDLAYARTIGLRVSNAVYAPDGVADYTLMLILMLVRDARRIVRRVDAQDYRILGGRHRELRDLTVGVVGTGRIGTAVVDRLRAFGCRTLAHGGRPAPGVEHVGLEQLLRTSDVVTLHAPLNAETYHLMDRERLAQLRPGALLVNTARGGLVDTAALVDALESGRLAGAAVDVLEGEERVFYADHRAAAATGDPLLRLAGLPNVLVSPHTAYYTDRALRETVEQSLVSCVDVEREVQRA